MPLPSTAETAQHACADKPCPNPVRIGHNRCEPCGEAMRSRIGWKPISKLHIDECIAIAFQSSKAYDKHRAEQAAKPRPEDRWKPNTHNK